MYKDLAGTVTKYRGWSRVIVNEAYRIHAECMFSIAFLEYECAASVRLCLVANGIEEPEQRIYSAVFILIAGIGIY